MDSEKKEKGKIEMSWEFMGTETYPCRCGVGTISVSTEMDDWNRKRYQKKINCEYCERQEQAKAEEAHKRKELRDGLLHKARVLAESRHLAAWMKLMTGKSKVDAWRFYTGGSGYPSLGTFRKHMKEEGQGKYFQRLFRQDIGTVLTKMGVTDAELDVILSQIDSLD